LGGGRRSGSIFVEPEYGACGFGRIVGIGDGAVSVYKEEKLKKN
jgi:hypothetical protein